jgi:hypothetical protein
VEIESSSNLPQATASEGKKTFRSPRKPPKKRKCNEDPRITEAYDILKGTPKDDCAVYADYVAATLRNLDERSQVIVRHKINSILFEAEMNKYASSSSVPPSPCTSENSTTSVNTNQTSTLPSGANLINYFETIDYDDES